MRRHACVCVWGRGGERAQGKRGKQSQTQDSAHFVVNFPLFPKGKYFSWRQSGSWGTNAKANPFACKYTSKHPLLLKLHRNCCIMKYSSQATMFTLKQLTHGTFPALLLSLAPSTRLLHILSPGRLRGTLTKFNDKTLLIWNILTVIFQELLYGLYTILGGETDSRINPARKRYSKWTLSRLRAKKL